MTVGQTYKADILKMVLGNMMNYTIANEDFSLTDNIVIYMTLLSIVVQEHDGSSFSPITIIYELDFFKTVIELADIYVDFLSEYYGVSKEEIRRLEEDANVQRIIRALSTLCSEQDYPDSEEKQYATNLIERFPLLKQILIMYPIELTEWAEFLETHSPACSENKQNYRTSQVGDKNSPSLIPQYTFRYSHTAVAENEFNTKKTLYYAKNNPEYQEKLNKDGLCYVKETGMEVSCCDGEEGEKIYWVSEALETQKQYHEAETKRGGAKLYLTPHNRKGGARI